MISEVVRIDDADLFQMQTHQGLSGVIPLQLQVVDRLAVDQHAGIVRIALRVDIRQLGEDVLIPVISGAVMTLDSVDRILLHGVVDVPDKADIVHGADRLVDRLADDDLVVVTVFRVLL